MNYVDIIFILFILIGAFIGFKRGMVSSFVSLVGVLFVIIGAYYLKTPVGALLYRNLPFMNFKGIFKGISSINILVYECIAFLICLIVLTIILKIVMKISGLIDKLIKLTIIFALPSKIIGALLGMIQYFLIAFVLLLLVSLIPATSPYVMESKFGGKILDSTPIVSKMTKNLYKTVTDIYDSAVNYSDKQEGNYNSLKALIDNKIISVDTAKFLVEKGKINLKDFDNLLNEYGGNKND